MLKKLDALTRHLVGDRRRHRRRRHIYDAVIRRNERSPVLFRGKTTNVSRSGVRMRGLPVGRGPAIGQTVRVELLLIPKNLNETEQRAIITGRVFRIEEKEKDYLVAVKFDRPLPD